MLMLLSIGLSAAATAPGKSSYRVFFLHGFQCLVNPEVVSHKTEFNEWIGIGEMDMQLARITVAVSPRVLVELRKVRL